MTEKRKYTRRQPTAPPSDNGSAATVQDYEVLPVAVEVAEEPDRAPVWKRIYAIDAGDMPFEHPLYPLFRTLRLRLENTPPPDGVGRRDQRPRRAGADFSLPAHALQRAPG